MSEIIKKKEPKAISLKESSVNDEEDEDIEDPVGKLVDFGPYGKLYVAFSSGDNFWVTDENPSEWPKDRHNVAGWYIKQRFAKKIIEESTLSTDIATKPERMGTVQKRVEPDDMINGIPVFDVDGTTFMKASKVRASGKRYGITCEKFNTYLRENGYRCSAAIRWNGNLFRVK